MKSFLLYFTISLPLPNAVFFDGDFHAVLDVAQEFVSQGVDDGHENSVHPNVGKHTTAEILFFILPTLVRQGTTKATEFVKIFT